MKPKRSKQFPGFYHIPNFSRYLIAKTGEIYDLKYDRELKPRCDRHGYYWVSLKNDQNLTRRVSRHRLLAIVFKHPGTDIQKLEVNHINGIKGSDALTNLEWVTRQGNIEHAGMMGLTPKCLPMQARNVLTGEVFSYPSSAACGRMLGITKDSTNLRARTNGKRVFPEMYQYRRGISSKPWPIPTEEDIRTAKLGVLIAVQMRDVLTGNVLTFDSLTDLAKYLKISVPAASTWLARPNQPVLPGYIQLKRATDLTPWRPIVDAVLELSGSTCNRSVVVIDSKTGQVGQFESAVKCAIARGITPTALNYRLTTKGRSIFRDGCRYIYYHDWVNPDIRSSLNLLN